MMGKGRVVTDVGVKPPKRAELPGGGVDGSENAGCAACRGRSCWGKGSSVSLQ